MDQQQRDARLGGRDLHGLARVTRGKRIEAAASNVACVGNELIYLREGSLVRASFDAKRGVLGAAVATGQRADWDPSTGLALFDVSRTGTLLCRESNVLTQSRLVWLDRSGAVMDTVSVPANYRQISVSRHANRAVASIGSRDGNGDIWLLDFQRGLASRFTNRPADEGDPLITPRRGPGWRTGSCRRCGSGRSPPARVS